MVIIGLICAALFIVIAAMVLLIYVSERRHEDYYDWTVPDTDTPTEPEPDDDTPPDEPEPA